MDKTRVSAYVDGFNLYHNPRHEKIAAAFFKKIQDRDLKKSLLQEQITYNGTVITVPAGWLPKPKPGMTGEAGNP